MAVFKKDSDEFCWHKRNDKFSTLKGIDNLPEKLVETQKNVYLQTIIKESRIDKLILRFSKQFTKIQVDVVLLGQ